MDSEDCEDSEDSEDCEDSEDSVDSEDSEDSEDSVDSEDSEDSEESEDGAAVSDVQVCLCSSGVNTWSWCPPLLSVLLSDSSSHPSFWISLFTSC